MDKTCRICCETKPLSEFHLVRRDNRPYSYCRQCRNAKNKKWAEENSGKEYDRQRNKHLKKKYGLSLEAFDAMLVQQGGRCACCKSPDPKTKLGWCVDHNHKTGEVRAILCRPCNQTIGYCGENVARLQMLSSYIKRFRPNEQNKATQLPGLELKYDNARPHH